MTKLIFIGYEPIPTDPVERQETIPQDMWNEIYHAILTAPEGEAAVFGCEDNLHAIKVADRLRVVVGDTCTFVARRDFVYAKRGK